MEWLEELTHQVEKGEDLDSTIPQIRLCLENWKKKIDEDFELHFQRLEALEQAYAKGEKIGYSNPHGL
jgi:hypothetical protein